MFSSIAVVFAIYRVYLLAFDRIMLTTQLECNLLHCLNLNTFQRWYICFLLCVRFFIGLHCTKTQSIFAT